MVFGLQRSGIESLFKYGLNISGSFLNKIALFNGLIINVVYKATQLHVARIRKVFTSWINYAL